MDGRTRVEAQGAGNYKKRSPPEMDDLRELMAKHTWTRNCYRTNTDLREENRSKDKAGRTWLVRGLFSNTVREGHPIVDLVRESVPCNAVCLNRRRADSPTPPMGAHRDGRNTGQGSWIAFWGCPEGEGALVTELGQRYLSQNVWHDCGDLSKIIHWVEPHTSGTRYSAVAFTGPPPRLKAEAQCARPQ